MSVYVFVCVCVCVCARARVCVCRCEQHNAAMCRRVDGAGDVRSVNQSYGAKGRCAKGPSEICAGHDDKITRLGASGNSALMTAAMFVADVCG